MLASLSTTTGQPDPLGDLGPQRLAAPVQVRGEHHDGAGHVDEARGPDPDRRHVVLAGEARDQVDDGVLDRAHVVALGRPALDGHHRAGRVDDRAEHLGAADVDPDGQRLPPRGAGAPGHATSDMGIRVLSGASQGGVGPETACGRSEGVGETAAKPAGRADWTP